MIKWWLKFRIEVLLVAAQSHQRNIAKELASLKANSTQKEEDRVTARITRSVESLAVIKVKVDQIQKGLDKSRV